MRLTIERAVPAEVVAALYRMYVEAFSPLRTRAAARHVLNADEFRAEMADERIEKYILWIAPGEPVALTTLASEPAAVPWISADYYTARFPRQARDRSLYYLGFSMVRADYEDSGVTARILADLVRRMRRERAVCGFDVSSHNDDRHHIGTSIARLSRSVPITLDATDVQTYYIADLSGAVRAAVPKQAEPPKRARPSDQPEAA